MHLGPIDFQNARYQDESIICINMLTKIENYYVYCLKMGEIWRNNLPEMEQLSCNWQRGKTITSEGLILVKLEIENAQILFYK